MSKSDNKKFMSKKEIQLKKDNILRIKIQKLKKKIKNKIIKK